MKFTIVIPARFGSTRLPGKPLALIGGKTMLSRVVELSKAAIQGIEKASILVATDDERIGNHCKEIGVEFVLTSPILATGTDRVAEAVRQMRDKPDFILNMQCDAPLTPPHFLRAMIDAFSCTASDVVTPVTQLSWEQLDQFRQDKLTTPFSGTSAIFDETSGKAFWFSKQIIPAIRNEAMLRKKMVKSPIFRHIGLYGYSLKMLTIYPSLAESNYEKLEGLEQLRILENGYTIGCVPVDDKGLLNMSGIDSPEDILRAEALISKMSIPVGFQEAGEARANLAAEHTLSM